MADEQNVTSPQNGTNCDNVHRSTDETETAYMNGNQPTPQPEQREITQTDHLNKRLLSSFLERLNALNPGPNDGTLNNSGNQHSQDFDDDDGRDPVIPTH